MTNETKTTSDHAMQGVDRALQEFIMDPAGHINELTRASEICELTTKMIDRYSDERNRQFKPEKHTEQSSTDAHTSSNDGGNDVHDSATKEGNFEPSLTANMDIMETYLSIRTKMTELLDIKDIPNHLQLINTKICELEDEMDAMKLDQQTSGKQINGDPIKKSRYLLIYFEQLLLNLIYIYLLELQTHRQKNDNHTKYLFNFLVFRKKISKTIAEIDQLTLEMPRDKMRKKAIKFIIEFRKLFYETFGNGIGFIVQNNTTTELKACFNQFMQDFELLVSELDPTQKPLIKKVRHLLAPWVYLKLPKPLMDRVLEIIDYSSLFKAYENHEDQLLEFLLTYRPQIEREKKLKVFAPCIYEIIEIYKNIIKLEAYAKSKPHGNEKREEILKLTDGLKKETTQHMKIINTCIVDTNELPHELSIARFRNNCNTLLNSPSYMHLRQHTNHYCKRILIKISLLVGIVCSLGLALVAKSYRSRMYCFFSSQNQFSNHCNQIKKALPKTPQSNTIKAELAPLSCAQGCRV